MYLCIMLMIIIIICRVQGASIIRMLESVLGSETFLAGLRLYLQTHQYSNAETNDLWSAMTEQVHRLFVAEVVSVLLPACQLC